MGRLTVQDIKVARLILENQTVRAWRERAIARAARAVVYGR